MSLRAGEGAICFSLLTRRIAQRNRDTQGMGSQNSWPKQQCHRLPAWNLEYADALPAGHGAAKDFVRLLGRKTVKRREERAKATEPARHAPSVHGFIAVMQVRTIALQPAACAGVWIFVAQLHRNVQPASLEILREPR